MNEKINRELELECKNRALWFLYGGLILGLLFLIMFGFIVNAAFTVKTNEIATSAEPTPGYMNDAARGPDNILRHVYKTTTNAINISYSSDNGTTWSEETVLSGSYAGLTASNVWGVVVSSNNTTAVLISTTNADHTYDLYLLIKWAFNPAWSWFIVTVSYFNSATYSYCDIGINDTNVILMVFLYSGNNCWKTFRLNDQVLLPAGAPNIWVGASTYPISCVANNTGKFWVIWQSWTGSNMRCNIRDFCQTVTARTLDVTAWTSTLGGVVCLRNDVICCAWSGYQSTTYVIWYLFLLPGYTTIISRVVLIGTTVVIYTSIGLTQNAANYVYISYYDDTNDNIKGFGGPYNMEQIEWQASGFEYSSIPGASDETRCSSGLSSLWPKVLQTNVGIPKTGQVTTWDFKDELGATDNYYKQICWDAATTYAYIFWAAPVISNYSMIDGYISEPYLHDFTVYYGNPDYVWWIEWLSAPSGGWFLPDENGTIYGYCPSAIGTYTFRIWVEDFYGMKAYRNCSFDVVDREGEEGAAPTEEEAGEPFQFNVSFIGILWFLFFAMAIILGTFSTIQKTRRKW